MTRGKVPPVGVMTLSCVAVVFLASCSVEYTPPQEASGEISAELYDAEFAHTRAQLPAQAVLARQILSDNIITESEYTDLYERFRMCMVSGGVTGFTLDVNGGGGGYDGSVSPELSETVEASCQAQFGFREVVMLYTDIRSNPLHYDPNEMQIQCLVRNRIVEPGFSPEEQQAGEDSLASLVIGHQADVVHDRDPVNYYGLPVFSGWVRHECRFNPFFDHTNAEEPIYVREERLGILYDQETPAPSENADTAPEVEPPPEETALPPGIHEPLSHDSP